MQVRIRSPWYKMVEGKRIGQLFILEGFFIISLRKTIVFCIIVLCLYVGRIFACISLSGVMLGFLKFSWRTSFSYFYSALFIVEGILGVAFLLECIYFFCNFKLTIIIFLFLILSYFLLIFIKYTLRIILCLDFSLFEGIFFIGSF